MPYQISLHRAVTLLLLATPFLVLAACGGGGATAPSTPGGTAPTYSIGGTATGLTGSVVLRDNNADNLTVTANGAFTFATHIAGGGAYSVSVFTRPAGQTCTVTRGSGAASSDVANIALYCATKVAVTTSGNHLLKDGAVWTPHGVILMAFNAPPSALNDPSVIASNAFYRTELLPAYQHYSVADFPAIKAWGADLVRFNVSQAGLDPSNALYSKDYVSSVSDAVLAARATGLEVIVCVFGKEEAAPVPLPSDATVRAWNVLAPLFNGDQGILYEMFNEPPALPTSDDWAAWAAATNPVIAAIRATGSTNVVIADGLTYGIFLDGAPSLADPLNQVAYATHPWFKSSASSQVRATWDAHFGNFAATAPVIATAWAVGNNNYCDANTPAAALGLLQYLQSKQIGLVGYAYDSVPTMQNNSIVTDYNGTPTTFANGAQCGQPNFGAGAIIQDWFRTGVPPSQPE